MEISEILEAAREAEGRADWSAAAYALGQATPEQAASFELLYELGHVRRCAGQLAEAIELLRRALQVRPNDVKAELELGIALRRDFWLAEALEIHSRLAAAHPKDDHIAASFAATLIAYGQPEKGLAIIEPILARGTRTNHVLVKGQALAGLGRYREAATLAQGVLATDPDDTRAWLLLAEAKHELFNPEVWVKAAVRAYQLYEDSALTRIWAAKAQRVAGDRESERILLEAALQLQPRAYEAHVLLGSSRWRQEDLDGAQRHFEQAVAIAPWDGQTEGMLATFLLETGRRPVDLARLNQIAEEQPRRNLPYFLLRVYVTRKESEAAVKFGRLAAQCFPEHVETHYWLGHAYAIAKQLEDALSEFSAAIDLDVMHGESWLSLAQTLAVMGRTDDAIAALEGARNALPPSDERPARLLDKLQPKT